MIRSGPHGVRLVGVDNEDLFFRRQVITITLLNSMPARVSVNKQFMMDVLVVSITGRCFTIP